MAETLETATQWSNLLEAPRRGRRRDLEGLAQLGTPGIVMCHVSHVYETGASLYYTLLARQREGRRSPSGRRSSRRRATRSSTAAGRSPTITRSAATTRRWLAVEISQSRRRDAAGGEGRARSRGDHEPRQADPGLLSLPARAGSGPGPWRSSGFHSHAVEIDLAEPLVDADRGERRHGEPDRHQVLKRVLQRGHPVVDRLQRNLGLQREHPRSERPRPRAPPGRSPGCRSSGRPAARRRSAGARRREHRAARCARSRSPSPATWARTCSRRHRSPQERAESPALRHVDHGAPRLAAQRDLIGRPAPVRGRGLAQGPEAVGDRLERRDPCPAYPTLRSHARTSRPARRRRSPG